MKAPDKIVLPAAAGEMRFLIDDTVYIRMDALLEWAKELQFLIKDKSGVSFRSAEVVINEVINKIKSL